MYACSVKTEDERGRECDYRHKEWDPMCAGCAMPKIWSHARFVRQAVLDVRESWAARFPQPEQDEAEG